MTAGIVFANQKELIELLAAGKITTFISRAQISSAGAREPDLLLSEPLFEAYYRYLGQQLLDNDDLNSSLPRAEVIGELNNNQQLRRHLAKDLIITSTSGGGPQPALSFWLAAYYQPAQQALQTVLAQRRLNRHWLFSDLLANYFASQRQQLDHRRQYHFDRLLLGAAINSAHSPLAGCGLANQAEQYHRRLLLDLCPLRTSGLQRLNSRFEHLPWEGDFLPDKIARSLRSEIESRSNYSLAPERADWIVAEYNYQSVARQLITVFSNDYRPYQQSNLAGWESFAHLLQLLNKPEIIIDRLQPLFAAEQQLLRYNTLRQQFIEQIDVSDASARRLARWLQSSAREYCQNFDRRQRQKLPVLLAKHFVISS